MYFFYLDESGHIDYNSDVKWYVLTALAIDADHWEPVNERMNQLKCQVFKRSDAWKFEVKSNWLRLPSERKKIDYLNKLSDTELKVLTDGLYEILLDDEHPKELISVVINKDAMLKKYGSGAWKPNLYAYKVILERISLFLNNKNDKGIVICDRFSNNVDDLVTERHITEHQDNGGYSWKNLKLIQENLFFVNSGLNNLIQLADLSSYNVFRAFRNDEPSYAYFEKIRKLFYQPESYSVVGTGIVIQPNPLHNRQQVIAKLYEALK